ncbi:hypothetical protein [Pseudomonas sp. TH15]|uniref:hypothetical protein n=1 Tax=Pseudomonas sp. TH15 TaxID=2796381 RepID=UPI001912182D|nr:hypothetical protein [Pseudomonas sp. TH15]MBK5512528.1 hypothetical protein [Pseudomonas sp. TH15]
MDSHSSLEIDSAAYEHFLSLWELGKFEGQRLGQAFYNHFRLHRLSDQTPLQGLYEADGKKALKVIGEVIQIK